MAKCTFTHKQKCNWRRKKCPLHCKRAHTHTHTQTQSLVRTRKTVQGRDLCMHSFMAPNPTNKQAAKNAPNSFLYYRIRMQIICVESDRFQGPKSDCQIHFEPIAAENLPRNPMQCICLCVVVCLLSVCIC